jgi:hypothetical protein
MQDAAYSARHRLDRAIACTCGSTAVLDRRAHAEDCLRGLWRDFTDAVDAALQVGEVERLKRELAEREAIWLKRLRQADQRYDTELARHLETRRALAAVRVKGLTDRERERVLWWLHRPVPPGPMKELDEAIIRKLQRESR